MYKKFGFAKNIFIADILSHIYINVEVYNGRKYKVY